MDEKLKQKLEAQLAQRPEPEAIVREFLQYSVWGAEPEDVERKVKSSHKVNPFKIGQTIDALDHVAGGTHPEGFLSQLVMIDGNQMLMDESDEGARVWLKDLAARMRAWTAIP
jgi:hypothetical protein